MRTLLVEDDLPLAEAVRDALQHAGFVVEVLSHGELADTVLRGTAYDLVVLDIGLPGLDGFGVLQRLRRRSDPVAVLMLTARDALEDRVRGLDSGADDYLVKPFLVPELVARCRALVRRGRSAAGQVLNFGPLTVDLGLAEARLHQQLLPLTAREWDLLVQLVLSAPNVVAKHKLTDSLSRWGQEISANAVEIYISRLRGKLGDAGLAVRTVRGMGYRLEQGEEGHA